MDNKGNGKPANDAVTESKNTAWKIPKVTAPGGVKINKGQRTDPGDAKNQYLALCRGSRSHRGSDGSKVRGRGNDNKSDI